MGRDDEREADLWEHEVRQRQRLLAWFRDRAALLVTAVVIIGSWGALNLWSYTNTRSSRDRAPTTTSELRNLERFSMWHTEMRPAVTVIEGALKRFNAGSLSGEELGSETAAARTRCLVVARELERLSLKQSNNKLGVPLGRLAKAHLGLAKAMDDGIRAFVAGDMTQAAAALARMDPLMHSRDTAFRDLVKFLPRQP